MSDLRNIPLDEISKASNPFHVEVCSFDTGRIIDAYPSLIIDNVFSSFNHQTNEYIVKQLVALNIDKDVLIKQTEELRRLNSKVQEMCDKAYEQGRVDERAKAIDEYNVKIKECCSVVGNCDFEDLDRIAERLKE